VEDELERQFVKDANAAFREANSGAKELKKLFRDILTVERKHRMKRIFTSDKELRDV
jgi:hypothetical protein